MSNATCDQTRTAAHCEMLRAGGSTRNNNTELEHHPPYMQPHWFVPSGVNRRPVGRYPIPLPTLSRGPECHSSAQLAAMHNDNNSASHQFPTAYMEGYERVTNYVASSPPRICWVHTCLTVNSHFDRNRTHWHQANRSCSACQEDYTRMILLDRRVMI